MTGRERREKEHLYSKRENVPPMDAISLMEVVEVMSLGGSLQLLRLVPCGGGESPDDSEPLLLHDASSADASRCAARHRTAARAKPASGAEVQPPLLIPSPRLQTPTRFETRCSGCLCLGQTPEVVPHSLRQFLKLMMMMM